MGGLGSRTTTPQQIVYDALKAADTGDSKAFVALSELGAWCVRAEEAQQQAVRFLESYCEAADPDPRADDDEEISVQDAYVMSALSVLGGRAWLGAAAVPEENAPNG